MSLLGKIVSVRYQCNIHLVSDKRQAQRAHCLPRAPKVSDRALGNTRLWGSGLCRVAWRCGICPVHWQQVHVFTYKIWKKKKLNKQPVSSYTSWKINGSFFLISQCLVWRKCSLHGTMGLTVYSTDVRFGREKDSNVTRTFLRKKLCVWERDREKKRNKERDCVCVCEWKRGIVSEWEREDGIVRVCERERWIVCVWVCVR